MSAFGTKRTFRRAQPMSAFGGKADMDQRCRNVRSRYLLMLSMAGTIRFSLTPQSGLCNFTPTGGFAANVSCKLVWSAVEWFKTLFTKRLLRFWRLHRLGCGVGKLIDDWPRCTSGP